MMNQWNHHNLNGSENFIRKISETKPDFPLFRDQMQIKYWGRQCWFVVSVESTNLVPWKSNSFGPYSLRIQLDSGKSFHWHPTLALYISWLNFFFNIPNSLWFLIRSQHGPYISHSTNNLSSGVVVVLITWLKQSPLKSGGIWSKLHYKTTRNFMDNIYFYQPKLPKLDILSVRLHLRR